MPFNHMSCTIWDLRHIHLQGTLSRALGQIWLDVLPGTSNASRMSYYYYYYKMYWLEWSCHSITVAGALNKQKSCLGSQIQIGTENLSCSTKLCYLNHWVTAQAGTAMDNVLKVNHVDSSAWAVCHDFPIHADATITANNWNEWQTYRLNNDCLAQ